MNFPKSIISAPPAGKYNSSKPVVEILRKSKVNSNGEEIEGTEEFWLVDGQGQVLQGENPYSSLAEAENAQLTYWKSLGF